MVFHGRVRIGNFTAGFDANSWRVSAVRGVTAWEGRIGPFYLRRSGLSFSRDAASKVFWALHDGPVGRLARARRECNQKEADK